MGHMTLCDENSIGGISYFLPHHGVLNEQSQTTKLRVVFNGSASTDTGVSLNDIQHTGPVIQDDLLDILLRFRQFNVVVCADIEKMYRMVWVVSEQRCLQKILWRRKPDEDVQEYTLNTITYGTRSAAYLTIRCLKQLGLDNLEARPEASNVILHEFYVDDMLYGESSVTEMIDVCKQVKEILGGAGFNLRKWISNRPEVIAGIQGSSSPEENVIFGEKDSNKTLGLYWSFKKDVLIYYINFPTNVSKVNKRSILSDISKIFDPLGLLSPSIVLVKILLQKLCAVKKKDESLPSNLDFYWRKLRKKFFVLNECEIERQVICLDPVEIQIHGFCDASMEAYGACVYIRSVDKNGCVKISLNSGKSKVALLKSLTIPRLKLSGALVLVHLVERIKTCMSVKFDAIFLWCDSTVVLNWISTSPHLLQTFVSNRVAQIQEKTDVSDW
ncbi:uncharacterized protein LOC130445807 [Diorhabda sublineata]|uniref:uncharacterized protein LOC130445807 n=1 Tax=Diorhabda sublineata TaxID=1163346 RepID=UPI0024E0D1F2|nr:uncharacterized protein LOC130445807 [Diorhabda sublineata]